MSKIGYFITCILLLSGCATTAPTPYDYSAYRASNPKSILVLPPVNKSPDTKASLGFYSNTQRPLAEAGYYVFPISLVHETFKNNGFTEYDDIHQINPAKLHEIFGADAAMYITITKYGTSYRVIASESAVSANATLVDLRSGATLWEGSASANSNEGKNNNQGGLAALLVEAIIKQVVGTIVDESHGVSKITNARLFSAGTSQGRGILYGPYHPNFDNSTK